MKPLTIAYLYPAEMNIYGDRGNVIALTQRCGWRGIGCTVKDVNIGDNFDFDDADIIFGGGGQDKGQELVAADLLKRQQNLKAAAEAGTPMLLICGLYQLFGHHFTTVGGQRLPGIGIFNLETVGGSERMIGNVVIKSRFGELVGFENHSGQTKLASGQEALGQVVKGSGNDSRSGFEGAVANNVIGTYLHGPVLPKNPALADWLIETALKRRGQEAALKPLDDALERQAAKVASDLPH